MVAELTASKFTLEKFMWNETEVNIMRMDNEKRFLYGFGSLKKVNEKMEQNR